MKDKNVGGVKLESWMPKLNQGRIEEGIDHDFQFKAYEIVHNGYHIVFKAKMTSLSAVHQSKE